MNAGNKAPTSGEGSSQSSSSDPRSQPPAGQQDRGEATAAQGADSIKVSVFHLGEGDEPFVCRCSGRVTAAVLADIDKALRENEGDYFPSGPGTYEFNVTHFAGQYGEYGRCEFAPGWEFENTGFEPLDAPSPAAPGKGEGT